ncbi:MAG: hypothetical protein ACM30D_01875 [Hyphomicrobiales bacterium]|jgi:hypothetical protein|nr:hypothetical protein [Xanthobacteraceae bacterium]
MTPAMQTASASVSLIAGLLALSSSPASAEAAAMRVIKCEGSFGRNASHASLVKAFGNNNVVYREIEGVQDKKTKASILYPADPKARLEFIWQDVRARRRPALIRAKDQSAWAAANGIRIGTALADVEKMNGKPFKLSGFDWDYGGRVTDWRDGALAKPQPGGCTLGIEFVHPEDAPEESLTKVSGDREILSDHADMRAVEPYVAVMTFSYPKR